MILDARVLQDEFIPKEVKHRDQETQILADNLKPLKNGYDAENTLFYGPSGVGKTCISKYVVEQLREQILDIEYQYINCWQDYNRFKVLYRLLENLNQTIDIHRQSTPKDEMIERLKNYQKMPYIVILDEADQLEDKKVLYDLYTIPNITLIIISNVLEPFFADMDERIRSRFRSITQVKFNPYSVKELTSILKDRAEWGLKPGSIKNKQLKQIAKASNGDARIGIGILRAAARKAEKQRKEKITDQIIQKSIPTGKQETKQKNIDNLNDHQKTLYKIIKKEKTIKPGTLYKKYRKKIQEPRSNRTLRKYLEKMEHYNLIKSEGKNKARKYKIKQK